MSARLLKLTTKMKTLTKRLSLDRCKIQQKNNTLSDEAVLHLSIVESAGGRISEDKAKEIFFERRLRQKIGQALIKNIKELQRLGQGRELNPIDYEILRFVEGNPALMADGECLAQAMIESGLLDEMGECLRAAGVEVGKMTPEQVLALAFGA